MAAAQFDQTQGVPDAMSIETETNTAQTPPHKDKAGEYAFGLLEGAERDAFEAQLQVDPTLAIEVARW